MKNTTELIREYKELYDKGVLSQHEYDFLKNSLLSQGDKVFEEDKDIKIRGEATAQAEMKRGNETTNNKGLIAGIVIFLLILGLSINGCDALLSDSSESGSDYSTYDSSEDDYEGSDYSTYDSNEGDTDAGYSTNDNYEDDADTDYDSNNSSAGSGTGTFEDYDYDENGEIDDQEFQDATNDYMDEYYDNQDSNDLNNYDYNNNNEMETNEFQDAVNDYMDDNGY